MHKTVNLILILAVLAFVISGCVAPVVLPEITQEHVNLLTQEVESYATEGSASVDGQLFAVTRGGDVKIGAGREVLLKRESSFLSSFNGGQLDSIENMLCKSNSSLTPLELEFKLLVRKQRSYILRTTANAQGQFRFEEVPPGNYVLEANLFWEVVNYNSGYYMPRQTGGKARMHLRLTNDSTRTVILRP